MDQTFCPRSFGGTEDAALVPWRYEMSNIGLINQSAERLGPWRWLTAAGAAMILLGIFALIVAPATTMLSVFFIGTLFILAAVFQFVFAFTGGRWSGFGLHLLLAVMYGLAGIFMLFDPELGAESLTVFLAFLFVVSGMFRIVASAVFKFPFWGLSLFGGLVTVALGGYVVMNLQNISLILLGMLFGIDLIFFGSYLATFGVVLRKMEKTGDFGNLRSTFT